VAPGPAAKARNCSRWPLRWLPARADPPRRPAQQHPRINSGKVSLGWRKSWRGGWWAGAKPPRSAPNHYNCLQLPQKRHAPGICGRAFRSLSKAFYHPDTTKLPAADAEKQISASAAGLSHLERIPNQRPGAYERCRFVAPPPVLVRRSKERVQIGAPGPLGRQGLAWFAGGGPLLRPGEIWQFSLAGAGWSCSHPLHQLAGAQRCRLPFANRRHGDDPAASRQHPPLPAHLCGLERWIGGLGAGPGAGDPSKLGTCPNPSGVP